MLETIREFASEQLTAAGERDALERRHLEHFAALIARSFDETLRGHNDLGALEAERDNIRAALDLAMRTDPALALEMAPKLIALWVHADTLREGQERIAAALAGSPDAPTAARAAALYCAAMLAHYQNDLEAGDAFAGAALTLYRELGDQRGIGGMLGVLGFDSLWRGDPRGARRHFEASGEAYASLGDEEVRLVQLGFMGMAVLEDGEPDLALALHREGVAGLRRAGTPYELATALANLGSAERLAGEMERARRTTEESLALWRQIVDRAGIVDALYELGELSRSTAPSAALDYFAEGLRVSREMEQPQFIAICLFGASATLAEHGDAASAATLLGASTAIFRRTGLARRVVEQAGAAEIKARCLARLSPEAFAAALDAGAAMDAEAAAEWALNFLEDAAETAS